MRVVEVWWDEYKDYFYASRPETLTLAYGDISELRKFREEHRCKSFKWFMEEIAYDIPTHYPLPPKNVEWGEVLTTTIYISVIWNEIALELPTICTWLGVITSLYFAIDSWLWNQLLYRQYGSHKWRRRGDRTLPSDGWEPGRKVMKCNISTVILN